MSLCRRPVAPHTPLLLPLGLSASRVFESRTPVRVDLAEARVVDPVKPDVKRQDVAYPEGVELINEVRARDGLDLRFAPQRPHARDLRTGDWMDLLEPYCHSNH